MYKLNCFTWSHCYCLKCLNVHNGNKSGLLKLWDYFVRLQDESNPNSLGYFEQMNNLLATFPALKHCGDNHTTKQDLKPKDCLILLFLTLTHMVYNLPNRTVYIQLIGIASVKPSTKTFPYQNVHISNLKCF